MDKLGLGLIGLGSIGRSHLYNCKQLKNAELVAVADTSKKALSHVTAFGFKNVHMYTKYEDLLLDKSVDAVIIALPTHLHATCVQKAAEAKKHILVEKPLARNIKEGKEMISSTKKNGVKLMVGYPMRFDPKLIDLKNSIVSGELGDVQVAHAINVSSGPFGHRSEEGTPQPVPRWWFQRELTGGGALIDLGSHLINLIRWYFGEVDEIKSFLGYRFNLDLEDHSICIAKFIKGPLVIFNVGWYSMAFHFKIDLLGTVKHASVSNTVSRLPRIIKAGVNLLTSTSQSQIPYLRELGHFVYTIHKDLKPSPSGTDGLIDLEVITKAYNNNCLLTYT